MGWMKETFSGVERKHPSIHEVGQEKLFRETEVAPMSDGERMREFAQTGNPGYLHTELAKRMGVMQMYKNYLKKYNLNEKTLGGVETKGHDKISIPYSDKLSKEESISLREYTVPLNTEGLSLLNDFARAHGATGLRTFLTNSYDSKMSERIFAFAALTDEAVVKNVFASYASTLDHADKIKSAVTDGRDKTDDITQFSSQLFEAFVRRSAHLFYGAEKIATSWYDAETEYTGETMRDLQESFHGISLLTGILADMQSGKHFTYMPDVKRSTGDNFFFKVSDRQNGQSYGLKMFVRPRAQTEVRSKKGGTAGEKEERKFQARINIELSLDELPPESPLHKAFFNQTEYAGKKKTVESSVIRFGLDLDDAYDPPRISFDMGRNEYQDESQKRTGDTLGRILDRVAPHGHHLIESFDPKFSDPDTFAKIAEEFRLYCQKVGK